MPRYGLTPEHLKKIYEFSHCEVTIDDPARYMQTKFLDGSIVSATPDYRLSSFCLSVQLGYGLDTWAMSKDHELIHTWLNDGQSPTLWRIAHPQMSEAIGDDEVSVEEQMVLDYQKKLDKTAPKPWDVMLKKERLCRD